MKSFKVMIMQGKNGMMLVRFSPEEYQTMRRPQDADLTPETMFELVPRMDELAATGIRGPIKSFRAAWAVICMHVGASIPQAAREAALDAFKPGGYWADSLIRVEIAKTILEEIKAYKDGPSARSEMGLVRFACEWPMDVIDSPSGGSRYKKAVLDGRPGTAPMRGVQSARTDRSGKRSRQEVCEVLGLSGREVLLSRRPAQRLGKARVVLRRREKERRGESEGSQRAVQDSDA